MTQLLTHTVAHSTRPSFRPKTNNQPIKKLSILIPDIKIKIKGKQCTIGIMFLLSEFKTQQPGLLSLIVRPILLLILIGTQLYFESQHVFANNLRFIRKNNCDNKIKAPNEGQIVTIVECRRIISFDISYPKYTKTGADFYATATCLLKGFIGRL